MSETLRDLVVSLSLNSDNFTRNIRSVQKQIQEAQSSFKLAGAGVQAVFTSPLVRARRTGEIIAGDLLEPLLHRRFRIRRRNDAGWNGLWRGRRPVLLGEVGSASHAELGVVW